VPKISVIIPIHNAEDFLCECLDTVVNQTLKDIEIILVDDGSTDSSLEILNRYAENDPRIRVIAQENAGAGAARNNGMRYATGEYLSILDCDDFFEADMLEKSYLQAKALDLDIIVFGCDFYDDVTLLYSPCNHSIRRYLLPKQEVFSAADVPRDVFKLFVGWAWDKLFRTSFIREHGLLFQEQRTTNDMFFVFAALIKAQRIAVMHDVLAHHRNRAGSLSVTREKSWMCFYNALIALREELYRSGCYERFEQDYKNYCINFALWNLNTLKEPTYTILYNKLRDEWFDELGLPEHPESYYYNKQEYAQFREVYENTLEQYRALQKAKAAPSAPPASPAARPKTPAKKSLPQKVIHSLKTHGLLYTVRLIFKKLMGR